MHAIADLWPTLKIYSEREQQMHAIDDQLILISCLGGARFAFLSQDLARPKKTIIWTSFSPSLQNHSHECSTPIGNMFGQNVRVSRSPAVAFTRESPFVSWMPYWRRHAHMRTRMRMAQMLHKDTQTCNDKTQA